MRTPGPAGRVAVIPGAPAGLGRAMARAFAGRGDRLAVGVDALALPCDASDPVAVEAGAHLPRAGA